MKVLLAVVVMLAFATPAWTTTPLPASPTRVEVLISSQDAISVKVKSLIGKELRSLDDVIVTDKDPEYILGVVAMTVTEKDGTKRGAALSVVALEPFNNTLVKAAAQSKYRKITDMLTSNLYRVSTQWLQVGSMNDLRNMCNDIVAQFDTEELAPNRKFRQSMKDVKQRH